MPDRAQDTEAIRAALELRGELTFYSTAHNFWMPGEWRLPALAALGRLVARLEAAEQALRYIAGYDVAGYDAHLRSEDVARAALAAAAPGETTLAKPGRAESRPLGLNAESGSRSDHSPGSASAAPGETGQTP